MHACILRFSIDPCNDVMCSMISSYFDDLW
jgi:hypothetical protein